MVQVTLIATMKGTAEGIDPIYFTCHMDTVVPGQGIKPELREDGYVYSDGTTILGADDKAGIAALFEMARTLKESSSHMAISSSLLLQAKKVGLLVRKRWMHH